MAKKKKKKKSISKKQHAEHVGDSLSSVRTRHAHRKQNKQDGHHTSKTKRGSTGSRIYKQFTKAGKKSAVSNSLIRRNIKGKQNVPSHDVPSHVSSSAKKKFGDEAHVRGKRRQDREAKAKTLRMLPMNRRKRLGKVKGHDVSGGFMSKAEGGHKTLNDAERIDSSMLTTAVRKKVYDYAVGHKKGKPSLKDLPKGLLKYLGKNKEEQQKKTTTKKNTKTTKKKTKK